MPVLCTSAGGSRLDSLIVPDTRKSALLFGSLLFPSPDQHFNTSGHFQAATYLLTSFPPALPFLSAPLLSSAQSGPLKPLLPEAGNPHALSSLQLTFLETPTLALVPQWTI